jgi:predicted nucleotidyltransferase
MVTDVSMMPTESVLGSPLRIRILRVLARHPTREFTYRELARFVASSHVGVAKALESLLAYDVVRRRRLGRAYAVRAHTDSALFQEVAKLFAAEDGIRRRLQDVVRRWCARRPEVLFALLFGSYARGVSRSDSDVDLLIVARHPGVVEADLDSLRLDVRRLLGRPLAPLVMSPSEARRLRNSPLLKEMRADGTILFQRQGWTLP